MSENLTTFKAEDIPIQYEGTRIDRHNIRDVLTWLGASYIRSTEDLDSDTISWVVVKSDPNGLPEFDLNIDEGDYVLRVVGEYPGRIRTRVFVVAKENFHKHYRYPEA